MSHNEDLASAMKSVRKICRKLSYVPEETIYRWMTMVKHLTRVPNIVACDRGYGSQENTAWTLAIGGESRGTRKRPGSPYTFDVTKHGANQTVIPKEGSKAVFWAKRRPDKKQQGGISMCVS